MLNRPLIQALETYSNQPPYQQPLLASVTGVMGAPGGRQLAALRGGDADPAAAAALLSLLGCCLRQACQWRQLGASCSEQVEALLTLGLPLAVGNAACYHKDTSLLAVGTLSALLALLLQRDSPLQPGLLRFAARHGGVLLQGLLLALLSLNSGSYLPKVGGRGGGGKGWRRDRERVDWQRAAPRMGRAMLAGWAPACSAANSLPLPALLRLPAPTGGQHDERRGPAGRHAGIDAAAAAGGRR